jgi:hypothetical protein
MGGIGDPEEKWKAFHSSARFEVQYKYYKQNVWTMFPFTGLVDEIAQFASEGYRIGQLLDGKDQHGTWCVVQIIDIDEYAIKVHYIGWNAKYNEWVNINDTSKLADLFSKTKPSFIADKSLLGHFTYDEKVAQNMIDFGCPEEQVKYVMARYGADHREIAVNALIYWKERSSEITDKDMLDLFLGYTQNK